MATSPQLPEATTPAVAQAVTVGTAAAEPGTIAFGAIPVTRLAGGAAVEIPVMVINGVRPGKVLWVDGAIHGDEPEGTLACQILRREVAPKDLAGTLVLVPAINVMAYEATTRGNPLDTFSYDANRVYPGRPDGYLTERVTYAHSQWMRKVADLEISIHSGGAHSFLAPAIFVDESPGSVELATAMGPRWGCIMSTFNSRGHPTAVMAEEGKAGIAADYGGRWGTSPKAMAEVSRTLADAILNVLRHYRMLPGEAKYEANRTKGVQEAVLAPASGAFIAEPDIALLEPMKAGARIARIVDIFGNDLAEITAPADGMLFGLRALTSVTTGDWCCFFNKVQGRRA